jgi:hypothetical protein
VKNAIDHSMSLEDAVAQVVDEGSQVGTFISCIRGRLAFHDEEIESRYIWRRP